jgi:hypothetical protein
VETKDRSEYFRQWQRDNKEKVAAATKRWRDRRAATDPAAVERDKEKARQKARKWYRENYEQARAYGRKYYHEVGKSKRTPRSRWIAKIRQKYGLTPEQYSDLLEKTGGKCAVCNKPFGNKGPFIDHCHHTNFVRGFLCNNCNTAEGMLGTPEIAFRMYEYMNSNHIFYPKGQSLTDV